MYRPAPQAIQQAVEDAIDKLISAHDRMVRAEIDACCCRTRSDWDRLHQRQDAYHDTREDTIKQLLALLD